MDFSEPPRRLPPENMLPMINVVFLLLIFFLMSAQLAPPEPFPVEPPKAEDGAEAEGMLTLYISAEGEIAFRDAIGQHESIAVLSTEYAALCDGGCEDIRVQIRADAGAPAEALAALLPALGAEGFASVQLVTVAP